MVVLNKIYTKTGDDGTTALSNGERVPKFHLRVSAYGSVDEVNASLGVVRLHIGEAKNLDVMILRIQNDLFDLGADLATPHETKDNLGYEPLRIIETQITRLESEIDQMNRELKPLKSFILPGGSALATTLHVSRTIARRAERLIVELQQQEPSLNPNAILYMNRLSDFLFVAARFANDKGASDILWVPGSNR